MAKPADPLPSRPSSLGRLPLTDRTVRSLKPPTTGRLDVWDEDNPGFGLRLSASGRRTWILMYRNGSTLRRFTLGQYPTLGLADARTKARDALRDVDHGGDPARRKAEERRADRPGDEGDRKRRQRGERGGRRIRGRKKQARKTSTAAVA